MLGFTRSNLQCGLLLSNSSDGDTPVVDCGVTRYAKSILANRVLMVPSVSFLDHSLLFVRHVQQGRYLQGGVMCLMPLAVTKSLL